MNSAKYFIGQIIHHKRFNYRGVIYNVDPVFSESEDWYNTMAVSRPPKNSPWYHVLVDNAGHTTYVAEQNLRASESTTQISHPYLGQHFSRYDGERYYTKIKTS